MTSRSRRRELPQVVLSPSGDVFVEASAIYSEKECAQLLRADSAFICVKLTQKETAKFYETLDSALAEIVARIGGARLRANRR